MIKTQRINPPIPSRAFDVVAYDDNHPEGPNGFGATEADALADLHSVAECDDDECQTCREWYQDQALDWAMERGV